jgi:hypothetical protein
MSPIEEDEWEKLTGDNEFERNRVGADILQRARILQLRNERRTEWLRWQAMYDTLTVTMADEPGQQMWLRYGIPPANKVTVSPLWTNRATSTPITNLRAAQRALFTTWASGARASTWARTPGRTCSTPRRSPTSSTPTPAAARSCRPSARSSRCSTAAPAPTSGRVRACPRRRSRSPARATATPAQGTNRGANAMTYFLPEGRVLITTEPTVSGERIGDMPNGRVAVKPNPTAEPQWRQGPQNETLVSAMPPYVALQPAGLRPHPADQRPASLLLAERLMTRRTRRRPSSGRAPAPTPSSADGWDLGDSGAGRTGPLRRGNPARTSSSSADRVGRSHYAHLSIVEVDLKAEAAQQRSAGEARRGGPDRGRGAPGAAAGGARPQERQAELRAQAEEEGQPPVGQGADFPPQDEEAQRLAAESGAGSARHDPGRRRRGGPAQVRSSPPTRTLAR